MLATKLVRVGIVGSLGLTLALAGCGSTDSTSQETASGSVAPLSLGLEPAPLDEQTTITVSMVAKIESFSLILLADALGELEKENISVEYALMPATEALPELAQGRTDIAAIGITAAMFNGIAEGADLRLVYPGPTNNTVDGLWVRTDAAAGETQMIATVGSPAGAATTAVVPISEYLASIGIDIGDVEFVSLPISDLAFGLKEGVVDSAWLNSPLHLAVQGTELAERVVTYDSKAYGTGYAMGPALLREHPEVAAAVTRALARTAQTYLTGDYKADPQKVTILAEVLGVTPEDVTTTPSLTFGLTLDTTVIDEAQRIWLDLGDLLSYSNPLRPSQYADTRFLDAVVLED